MNKPDKPIDKQLNSNDISSYKPKHAQHARWGTTPYFYCTRCSRTTSALSPCTSAKPWADVHVRLAAVQEGHLSSAKAKRSLFCTAKRIWLKHNKTNKALCAATPSKKLLLDMHGCLEIYTSELQTGGQAHIIKKINKYDSFQGRQWLYVIHVIIKPLEPMCTLIYFAGFTLWPRVTVPYLGRYGKTDARWQRNKHESPPEDLEGASDTSCFASMYHGYPTHNRPNDIHLSDILEDAGHAKRPKDASHHYSRVLTSSGWLVRKQRPKIQDTETAHAPW